MSTIKTIGGVTAALVLQALVPVHADSADACSLLATEQQVRESVATASLWANVLARRASIRSESTRLLREAQEAAARSEPPAGLCPDGCDAPRTPEIVFRSAPRKVRTNYSGEAYCQAKFDQTAESPLFYTRSFASEDQLEEWVQDLAMGDGPDGKDLYERCDNACSPRYTYVIHRESSGLTVDTSIVCGHARDRDDNKFDLSYRLRWTCDEVPERTTRLDPTKPGPLAGDRE